MNKKVKYYIDSNNEFVIENYNLAGTFSNFLPGIAGLFGIPMWVFYVNRGQCVCSFGLESKNSPIMEFLPANRAYQLTSSQGFRTFIKIKDGKKSFFYEPFHSPFGKNPEYASQKMFISSSELGLQETIPLLGLDIGVRYFTVPNESFSSLARVVTITNISGKNLALDIADGIPIIVPYGVSNFFLQKMRRTIEAWMVVDNLQKGVPFYRLKVDPRDVSEVVFVNEGNFYMTSLSREGRENRRLPIAVDPELIFGELSDFSYPVNFIKNSKFNIPAGQMGQNKLPCAMSHAELRLRDSETVTLYSLAGHMSSKEKLNALIPRLIKEEFFTEKREMNKDIIKNLQNDVFTLSDNKAYDLYCAQTFLDNVMRGGYPVSCGNGSNTFYVYSRKHGDLERDYNAFSIEPTYFSQGNGNFRDMNQNRRSDIFFNPEVKDSNILHFYNLLQADGFNPLILRGIRFRLKSGKDLNDILQGNINEKNIKKTRDFFADTFTPGELFMWMEKSGVKSRVPWNDLLSAILENCETVYCADHGEGFWVDHWTYNIDLVENYIAVYPEKLKEILLNKKEFTFYDNIFGVRPRFGKYFLCGDKVRQYHALSRDAEKEALIKSREKDPHVVRTDKGKGGIYKTTLLGKLLSVTANKLSSLDPSGIGIEMEADKPGWCDSMNGLPGLFGSSSPEVFELKKQLLFILDSLRSLKLDNDYKTDVPEELYGFLKGLEVLIEKEAKSVSKEKDFHYWDKSGTLKENYREDVRLGFSGIEKSLTALELKEMLEAFLLKVNEAVNKAYIPSKKTYATYFINEVTDYEIVKEKDSVRELPLVRPAAFKSVRLPLYLEGAVRAMKTLKDVKKAKNLYVSLKNTALYDKKLKMYKINESLNGISKEVGRSSIFTPGWLENESIWLHMEYKYILEILKAGLYKEFFEEFRNVLIPFQKPEVYGRSVLENSSFLVSSAFPDKKLHGRGFVARLSGSTAEMLSIWLLMNAGPNPFFLNEKRELNLKFSPILPAWLFTKKAKGGFPKNSYAFNFLGKVLVVYNNPRMKDTVGPNAPKVRFIILRYENNEKIELRKDIIEWPYSKDIRDGKVKSVNIYLG
jgi:hypothetical protein